MRPKLKIFFFWIFAIWLITFACGCKSVFNIRKVPPAFSFDGRQALTVVSFNIRVGYGVEDRRAGPYELKDRKKKLGPIIGAIRSSGADVVGLQEVLGYDQALKLGKQLNMNVAYAHHPSPRPAGPWWGVALLSKFPIKGAEGFQISSGMGNSKRALLCEVDVGGRIMYFVSIHKDKDLSDGGSFKKIMRKIKPLKGPVVLIGDLNMSPFDNRLNILKSRFADSAEGVDSPTAAESNSLGTFFGLGRIDYVLVEPELFTVSDVGLAERKYRDASDHLAYWAKIIPKN